MIKRLSGIPFFRHHSKEEIKRFEKIREQFKTEGDSILGAQNSIFDFPQDRLLDWLISKLIPKSIINTLLKLKTIKFRNNDEEEDEEIEMEEMDFKDKNTKKSNSESTGLNIMSFEEDMKNENENNDETPQGDDGNSDTPGGMSRRHNARNEMLAFKNELKDLLGAYLSKRKESKYEIIETVMKMVVFGDGKVDEIKFLDEALKHTSHSDVQNNLQRYMKKKGMLLSQGTVKKANPKNEETKKPEDGKSYSSFRMPEDGENEVIKFNEACKFRIGDGDENNECVMCISNMGIYILKEHKKSKKKTDYVLLYAWRYNQIVTEPRVQASSIDNSKNFIFEIPHERSFFSGFFGIFGGGSTETPGGTDQGTATGTATGTSTGDTLEVAISFVDTVNYKIAKKYTRKYKKI